MFYCFRDRPIASGYWWNIVLAVLCLTSSIMLTILEFQYHNNNKENEDELSDGEKRLKLLSRVYKCDGHTDGQHYISYRAKLH